MNELALLADLHRDTERQGPCGQAETRLAIELSGLRERRGLRIADLGCGTGASTLVLAHMLDASIVAVDFLEPFLETLTARADDAGVAERIIPCTASMEALDFAAESLDAIWSEGAIYNIGFERGVREWHRFLKPGGILAVSELTWLTERRPAELDAYWREQYAEVDTAAAKMALLEHHGYAPLGYFVLPRHCWLEGYYLPLQQRFQTFLSAHENSAAARTIVQDCRQEIDLYERYSQYFGYGFYIARKSGEG
ncbi:methyltransferase type 11 [Vreelandella aquamarina]|uniref:Methyltransferase domain-containing protein n=1 Tax=Vreelandella aquamarina TaxID=77097 RepID=A0A1N6EMQ8_9GAMM|nr:class I SAM-dependent methyltransferase [Halomonas meridiana]GED47354.1 methyltransferase type 11 [Halomonas meridiana]SIN84257.1 Methyltransferase domain-containing protein [Halomonas meridiana]SIN88365.1 Methyltransferase domain-containing protein [Halomonas meridiana]SIO51071.1 Methyltransferase domain-containing protein [Halomonas meridiana]